MAIAIAIESLVKAAGYLAGIARRAPFYRSARSGYELPEKCGVYSNFLFFFFFEGTALPTVEAIPQLTAVQHVARYFNRNHLALI